MTDRFLYSLLTIFSVFFLKRAQIFVASVWCAFSGTGYGAFDDIHALSMFADYR